MQLDLFSGNGIPAEYCEQPESRYTRIVPGELDDDVLIAAIPKSGVAGTRVLCAEAGRRKLGKAVPTLERLCRRFSGFGCDHEVPEQIAAINGLAAIGDAGAAAAVGRLITKGVVQGPTLTVAIDVARRLRVKLPAEAVLPLLRHGSPDVRAKACRCIRQSPVLIPILVDLLDDLNAAVSTAAACALGRMGRTEALPILIRLLRVTPSLEVIDALAGVADEEAIVLLGRITDIEPAFTDAALDALHASDDPLATRIIDRLSTMPQR